MGVYPKAAMERAMKVQEVILRSIRKVTERQSAAIIGLKDRPMRHSRECEEEERGYDDLMVRQRDCPSSNRVPPAQVEEVGVIRSGL